MLRIRCRCGETFHASEDHVGRKLRCRCGRTLAIHAPASAAPAGARTRVAAAAGRWWAKVRGAGSRRGAVRPGAGSDAGLAAPRAAAGRVLVRAGWIYLAGAVVVWIGLWRLADRWWPATALLFGPRWILLLPLLLLAPAAVWLRRAALLPLALAAGILLVPVMGFRLGVRGWGAGERGASEFRVVTLNAAGRAMVLPHLRTGLRQWDADIVAIQECGYIKRVLETMHGWHTAANGEFCLISRFPFEVVATMEWEDLDMVRSAGLGGTSAAVRYRVDAPGGAVDLVNLHLETPRKGLQDLRYGFDPGPTVDNTLLRAVESRRAFRWLGPERDSLIVVGDFNMPVESIIYRESWSEFTNAFSHVGRGLGATKDNGWIQVRIDHVLAGQRWRVRRAWVGPDVGSDHRPVIADLRWGDDA